MNLRTAVFLLCVISMTKAQEQEPNSKADAIFLHGNIYTGVAVVSSFHEIKRAEAMAIRGDRLQAVGAESDILKLKGPQTEVVNLNGRFVMPGFNDAHLHLASAGFERLTVNLVGVKSLTEFRDRIRERVETAGPGEWIVGRGWDHTLWPVKELPSRWDIDEVTTDHPVSCSAWMVTLPWPTRELCNSQASRLPARIPQAGKSIAIPPASPPGFCARLPEPQSRV